MFLVLEHTGSDSVFIEESINYDSQSNLFDNEDISILYECENLIDAISFREKRNLEIFLNSNINKYNKTNSINSELIFRYPCIINFDIVTNEYVGYIIGIPKFKIKGNSFDEVINKIKETLKIELSLLIKIKANLPTISLLQNHNVYSSSFTIVEIKMSDINYSYQKGHKHCISYFPQWNTLSLYSFQSSNFEDWISDNCRGEILYSFNTKEEAQELLSIFYNKNNRSYIISDNQELSLEQFNSLKKLSVNINNQIKTELENNHIKVNNDLINKFIFRDVK